MFIVPSQISDTEIQKWRFGFHRRFEAQETLIWICNSDRGVPEAFNIFGCPNCGPSFASLHPRKRRFWSESWDSGKLAEDGFLIN
jgi:hypothetical protein